MSKGGATAPEVLSAPLERVHALAVTSEWLFVGRMDWASDSASLLRIPLTGGEPEMLLADGWVYDLEVDGEQATVERGESLGAIVRARRRLAE